MNDDVLLRTFAESGCEDCFRALVERYLDLVYGIALRRTGNRGMAEEVAQNAFAVLARKAERLQAREVLAGWLMKTARLEAAKAMRSEYRRRRKLTAFARERIESSHDPMAAASEAAWERARPHLDAAMDVLRRKDQEAIALRFYRNKTYREIGELTGMSEDGVRKQIARALAKLSGILRRKGAVLPVAALASWLATGLGEAAPAALSGSVAAGALSTASSISSLSLLAHSLQTMTSAKQIAAAAVLFAALLTAGYQWNTHRNLARESKNLRDQYAARSSQAGPRPARRSIVGRDGRGTQDIVAPADLESGGITWKQLIELYANMNRLGSSALRDLFYAKLRALDEQRSFHAHDLDGVLAELREAGAPRPMVELVANTLVMLVASRRDPEGAANLILESDDYPKYRLQNALENWARKDPDDALAWFEARTEEGAFQPKGARDANLAQSSYALLLAGIAQTDLPKAARRLKSSPPEVSARALYRMAFELTEPEEYGALLDAFAGEEDDALRHQVFDAYAKALVESKTAGDAWEYLLTTELNAEKQADFMTEALRYEIERNFRASPDLLEWIARHPERITDSNLARTAISRWQIYDRKSADAWLEKNRHRIP